MPVSRCQPPTIGPYRLSSPVMLAPMAGITDAPFRTICRRYGAGHAVAEMVSANPDLQGTRKSLLRSDISADLEPRAIQIVGGDVDDMVQAAIRNAQRGAQIIDINMGCPAKKVCRKAAGSALLRDPVLVAEILVGVVAAVDVPVTLKIRTGWSPETRNAEMIAGLAQAAGIQALTIHGRSRQCGYRGAVEYDTIRRVKENVSIPVFANGDITSPEQAEQVLNLTGVDGVVIGRAAQGQPWIFHQINEYLQTGLRVAPPDQNERLTVIRDHLLAIHRYYGDVQGVAMARKHFGWYCADWGDEGVAVRKRFNQLESPIEQLKLLESWSATRRVHYH